jgi:hypothetical protein
MWISFAWTTDALLAGLKTVTRRDWTDGHASKFHKGDYTDAWTKIPRCAGAKKVAVIYHTADPYRQWLHDVTDEDEIKEGHLWGSGMAFREAMGIDRPLYVVEFKLITVL